MDAKRVVDLIKLLSWLWLKGNVVGFAFKASFYEWKKPTNLLSPSGCQLMVLG